MALVCMNMGLGFGLGVWVKSSVMVGNGKEVEKVATGEAEGS